VASALAADRAIDGPGSTAGILYGTVVRHPTTTTRVIEYAYPEAFAGTVDITLAVPAAYTGHLWETTNTLDESLGRLTNLDVVYLLTSTARDPRGAIGDTLDSVGWRLVSTQSIGMVDILRYERDL
jgi:mannosyltransferase